MTHITCRLTAKNRDQLRNPTLGNLVWAAFYRDSVLVDNTDDNSRVFSLIQICWVAVSKGMQAVKLCTNKIF